jgi:pimeloyl-ACP methyl ester carboxylesterase
MQQEMALLGYRTLAVDLPGRDARYSAAYHRQDLAAWAAEPSALAGVKAADTVAHVVDIVRRASKQGPVILVGHSLGGLTISGAGNAIPDLIDRLVYIAAHCPVDRMPAEYLAEYAKGDLFAATAPIIVGNPAELGYIRLNWRTIDLAVVAALKAALAPEATDQGFYRFMARTQPDEVFWQNENPGFQRVEKETWGRIPRTYIRLANDRSAPVALQDLYIKEADTLTPDNPFDVHSAQSSHGGFLAHPREVAEILAGLS